MHPRLVSLMSLSFAGALSACAGPASTPVVESGIPALPATGTSDPTTGVLGMYRMTLDESTVSLEPVRHSEAIIGSLFNATITAALLDGICHDCLRPTGVRYFSQTALVEFELRHPLSIADDLLPPSALNRRDLWLSTVKGIFLVPGQESFFGDTVRLNADRLIAPDGYTNLLPLAGDPTAVYPYKVFGGAGTGASHGNFNAATGWNTVLNNPTGYAVFANGQSKTATYSIHLEEGETIALDFVLTGSFIANSVDIFTRLTPVYYMPAGAPPEPWKVGATIPVGQRLNAADDSSSVPLTITMFDWQQDAAFTVDTDFPDPANPQGLAVSSRLAEATLEVPGILLSPETLDLGAATGTGYGSEPWTLEYELFNELRALGGDYLGIVKFLDERDPLAGDPPFENVIFVGEDLETPYTPPAEFASYAVFTVEVNESGGCTPGGPGQLVAGDYPENDQRGETQTVYNSPVTFQTGWNRFFTNPDTRPPLPTVDFAMVDVLFYAAGQTETGAGARSLLTTSTCANATTGYLVIEGIRYEPLSCTPAGPSHPWSVIPIPKGAGGWIINVNHTVADGCP